MYSLLPKLTSGRKRGCGKRRFASSWDELGVRMQLIPERSRSWNSRLGKRGGRVVYWSIRDLWLKCLHFDLVIEEKVNLSR
jgi:hypothetical protein